MLWKTYIAFLPAYVWKHKIPAALVIYMLFSVVLHLLTPVDITIPCVFRLATGLQCPGCGLTHAFTDIITLDFKSAWQWNPMIYIVLPAGAMFLVKDYVLFVQRNLTLTTNGNRI